MYVTFSVFCVLFVCKCVLYYCHRVSAQLLLNIYHIISYQIISYHTGITTQYIPSYNKVCLSIFFLLSDVKDLVTQTSLWLLRLSYKFYTYKINPFNLCGCMTNVKMDVKLVKVKLVYLVQKPHRMLNHNIT
jgi:hypothetical protein